MKGLLLGGVCEVGEGLEDDNDATLSRRRIGGVLGVSGSICNRLEPLSGWGTTCRLFSMLFCTSPRRGDDLFNGEHWVGKGVRGVCSVSICCGSGGTNNRLSRVIGVVGRFVCSNLLCGSSIMRCDVDTVSLMRRFQEIRSKTFCHSGCVHRKSINNLATKAHLINPFSRENE